MGIKGKLLDDAQQIVGRANVKIKQLDSLTAKLLLPGFKEIAKDVESLGAIVGSLSYHMGSFMLDKGGDSVYFSCFLGDAKSKLGVAYVDDVFIFFDAPDPYATRFSLPRLPGNLQPNRDNILTLNSDNISDFEKYMDVLMSYITRNSTLIIDTIEDATIDLLKNVGKF